MSRLLTPMLPSTHRGRPDVLHRLTESAPLAVAAILFSRHLFADLYGDEWGHTRLFVTGDSFWTDLLSPEVSHPPLFFILARLAWAATHLDWAMRLPSLIAALATVWLVGLLARKVGGRSLAAPTRWLAACSPYLMDFATEARAYSLLILFATGSVWAFLRMMDSEDRRAAVVLGVMLTGGMLTHYFFGFLLGYLLLWYVCKRSRFTVPAAIAFAPPILAAALFGTLVFLVQGGAASVHLQVEWMREHLHVPNFLARLAVAVNYGYCTFWLPPLDPAPNVPAGVVTRNIPQFIMLGVAAIGFVTAFWHLLKARTRHLAFLSFGLVVPTVVAVCAGAMGIYLIREKHLAVIWPFALILAAMAVRILSATWLGRAAVAAHFTLIALSTVHFLVYPNVYSRRMDWAGLRAAIESAHKPDVVLAYRLDTRIVSQTAFTTDAQRATFVVVRGSLRPGETLVGLAQRLHADTAGRILLVSHETDRHMDDPRGLIPKTLASLRPAATTPYGRNLQLYVYEPRPK